MLKDIELGNINSAKGHDHGERDEKPEKPKRPTPWYVNQAFEIKCFVYGMMTYAYLFAIIYLHEPLKANYCELQFSRFLSTFFIFMALTSYYRCSTNLSHLRIPWVPGSVQDTKFKTCKKCNHAWKPERAHHCSQCNRCIGRMDHHCPWINNCVGYANHKAFFCFCFYTSLGTFYYVYLSGRYIWDIFDSEDIFERHGVFFYGCWMVLGTVVFGTGLWMFGLAGFTFKYAINNITGIETLSRWQMSYPCFGKYTPYQRLNPYDKGQLANVIEFFGDDYLLWWFPTIMRSITKANFHSSKPKVSDLEKYEQTKGTFVSKVPMYLRDFDYQGWIQQSETFCSDKNIQFLGMALEVGKRQDNTFGTVQVRNKFDFEMETSAENPDEMTVKSFCAAPVDDNKFEWVEAKKQPEKPVFKKEEEKTPVKTIEEQHKNISKELDDFFGEEGSASIGFQNPIVK